LCRHHGLENKGFVPEFIEALAAYDWPGNVRELISTLEKTILADREAPTLFPMHLPRHVRLNFIQSGIVEKRKQSADTLSIEKSKQGDRLSIPVGFSYPPPILKHLRDQVMEKLESFYLRRLMFHTQNDLDQVGRLSGLSKNRIYVLLKKYNISRF
jgi:two-component system NtrC family response regulator